MTENEWKGRIRSAVADEIPDLLPRIRESCARSGQMEDSFTVPRRRHPMLLRAAALAAGFALFFTGLAVGRLWSVGEKAVAPMAETCLYMDVNPSIALRLDGESRVVGCEAGNEDAEAILDGLELVGVERNTALSALLGAMYVNGYLSAESNSVLISVDAPDSEETAEMLSEITEEINAVFARSEMNCSIIAQRVEVSEEMRSRAETYGVSIGKLYLIEKMIGGMESLDESDLSGLSAMSVGELNLMYATQGDTEIFADDVVTGLVGGFIRAEEAFSSLLDAVDLKEILLEEYETTAGYAEIDGRYRPVYEIRIRMKYSGNEYHFTVDCETGNLISSDFELHIPFPDFGIGGK